MLASDPSIHVVAEAASGPEAIVLQKQISFDAALVDLRLPAIDGIETLAALLEFDENCRVLMISSFDAEDDVSRALEKGAKGYLLKDVSCEELLEAIQTVAAGGHYKPAWVVRRVAEHDERGELSPREVQVLTLIAKGLHNDEIAALLCVSPHTVKTYTKRLFAKLHVTGRTEAATAALQRGILHVP